ncbi:MAG: oligosaccharide flippase family protein, partial [Clostridia bacterium]|nr:oligosaccharide flippase family protein [Clostridia bacterium]
PQVMMTALDGSMTEVLYPAFSKTQDNLQVLKNSLRKSVSLSMYIVLPLLFGLLVVAEPLTLVLLTEKWLPSVPFMQFSCVICMFWPLSHRTHALNALGKSGVTFTVSLIGKAITLIAIFSCLPFGMYALMIGTIIASAINMFVSTYFVKKYVGYSLWELTKDVLPSLCLSLVMGGVVFLFSFFGLPVYLQLVLQVLTGIAIYVLGSYLLKFNSFFFILNYAKRLLKRKK